MVFYSVHRFDYDALSKTYEAELEELGIRAFPNTVKVYDPDTQRTITFTDPEIINWNVDTDKPCEVEYSCWEEMPDVADRTLILYHPTNY